MTNLPDNIVKRVKHLGKTRDMCLSLGIQEPADDYIGDMLRDFDNRVKFYVRSTLIKKSLGVELNKSIDLPFRNFMIYMYDAPITVKGAQYQGVYLHQNDRNSVFTALIFKPTGDYEMVFLDKDFLDTGVGFAMSSNPSSQSLAVDDLAEDGDTIGCRDILLGFMGALASKESKFTTYQEDVITRVPKAKNPNKLKTIKSNRRVFYVEDAKRTKYHSSLGPREVNWTHRWPRKAHYRRLHNPESIGKDSSGERNQIGRTWVTESICGPADAELMAAIRVVR